MLKIDKLSIEEKTVRKSKELDAFVSSIIKHKLHSDPDSLLPSAPYHVVSFNLLDTNIGFANDIRRTLVEGIDVVAADLDDSKIKTDDEFIFGTSDVLIKNINLLPVNQDLDFDEMKKYTVYLLVANKTAEIIDVNASDFIVGHIEDVRKKNTAKLQKDLGDPSLHKKAAELSKHLSGKKAKKPMKKGGGKAKKGAEESGEDEDGDTKKEDEIVDEVVDDIPEEKEEVEEKHTEKHIDKHGKKKTHTRHSMADDLEVSTGTTKITEAMLNRAYSGREKSIMDIKKIFPNPNICIARLRPGKSLYIEAISFVVGKGSESMAKFSLLNNVQYQPINVTPFDIFTGKGQRSSTYSPKDFHIGFTTAGNIKPKDVIKKTVQALTDALLDIKKHVETYAGIEHKKYYSSDDLIVTIKDDVLSYKFMKHYYTPISMIAKKCFLIDPNVLFCTSGVERFDTSPGIIRLKHSEPNKLLFKAIDGCIGDLKILLSAFQ